MKPINERIAYAISESGKKKSAIAQMINVSPAFISQLCAGDSAASDRTISDLCAALDLSEKWLRTGEGEMYKDFSREEEIGRAVRKLLDRPETFHARLVTALLRVDPEDPRWSLLEEIVDNVIDEYKKETDP